ncbi:MAG TPA: PEP/pyruvate-binding domain-containing protein [Streptosporangiaceae bacterium]
MSRDDLASAGSRLPLLGTAAADEIDSGAVGAKAANLMVMADAGLPVPPGFVLGTEVCADYHRRGGQLGANVADLVRQGIGHLERATGRRFGGGRRPLLVSVRSGAAVSMPGMLDSVLDIGLCDSTLPGLLRATGDPVFVWDSYRRLIQSYAEVAGHCPAAPFAAVLAAALSRHGVPAVAELDVSALREVAGELQSVYQSVVGRPFPQDPMRQLLGAVEAVLQSWNADRAVEYRRLQNLGHLQGTAVTVQAMVFGNLGVTSGSGVGFTRDPATGENRLFVDFLLDAQGDDVVGGRYSAPDPEALIGVVPGLGRNLQAARRTLEAIFRDAQDFEFTVEEGKLWLLQARAAKRTPWAALQIASDLVDEGVIDQATALERLRSYDLDDISRTGFGDGARPGPIGHGTPASHGAASGRIALDVPTALREAERHDPVILVRAETSTEDIAALAVCQGLVTGRGARTSHAAVIARQLGIACLVNCGSLSIDLSARRLRIGDVPLAEGDQVTVDGTAGAIYPGALELTEERPTELISRVRGWQHQQGSSISRR